MIFIGSGGANKGTRRREKEERRSIISHAAKVTLSIYNRFCSHVFLLSYF